MASKRGVGKQKKATVEASRDNEWVPLNMGEMEIIRMVEAGILSNRVTVGWRPASGEPFPMPHTDEVVVLKIISSTG